MGDEIVDLQSAFNRYDADGSGDISNRELIVLIEECFADMAHDEQMRPHLAELMSEVDADKSGSLDFSDFIRLMQQVTVSRGGHMNDKLFNAFLIKMQSDFQ